MRKRVWFGSIAAGLMVVLLSSYALGVSTKFWSSATYEDFAPGNFASVSLNREGTLTLAPQLKEVFSTDQAVIWAVARDHRGNIYLGTGHSGKVFKLGPDLKGSVFFEAPEPDIFALAVDKENHVYAASSPDGKIYKIDANGKGREFFDPQAKYIWAMTFAPDGTLYVGTGDRGKIFRVSPDGHGELFYDTHQTHIMSLATTANDDLIAGSEPNGLLYRFSSSGKAFVLYDSPLSEIHRVAVAADGSIYASALGSSEERRMRTTHPQGPASKQPVQTYTSITVRASSSPGILPPPGRNPAAAKAGTSRTPMPVTVGPLASRKRAGNVIKSALYRVAPDGSVDTLWDSKRENVFDLLPSDGSGSKMLFSTDDKGRIYELMADRHASLVTETDQEETTRLIPYKNFVLATTANLGKVFRVGTRPAKTGSYESSVRDTGAISTWGKMRWTADTPARTSVELFTRTGNSGRPDATWSNWSGPYRQQSGAQITSPSARYIQWKAVFHSDGDYSPALHEVTVPYLERNQAPVVTELKVVPRGQKALDDGSGASKLPHPGYAASIRPAPQKGFNISWQASDPDQDELTYNLYFRGEGETEWKLLEGNLRRNYFQLESDVLPDGKYRLKLVASDADVNPAGMAKTAEMISAPFIVDNAPPIVEVREIQRTGASAIARFRAFDRTSALTRAEYVLDAGTPVPLLSDDGIIDSQEETFTIHLSKLDAREHLLTLRVYDSAGNMGIGKALWAAVGASHAK